MPANLARRATCAYDGFRDAISVDDQGFNVCDKCQQQVTATNAITIPTMDRVVNLVQTKKGGITTSQVIESLGYNPSGKRSESREVRAEYNRIVQSLCRAEKYGLIRSKPFAVDQRMKMWFPGDKINVASD